MNFPITFASRYLAKKHCKELGINVYTIAKLECEDNAYIIMVPLMFDDGNREMEVESTCESID